MTSKKGGTVAYNLNTNCTNFNPLTLFVKLIPQTN
ncbi:hypothetical protein Flavo103_25470 [Flavobacterium collinsii]|jgi:hypothetical protein|nr:hypothetical protein Flavo103_25470 [Flavobacterium collinsii]